MSRIAPQIPTASIVAPGTFTSSTYYTSVGWSAGEYVYRTPTNEISSRKTGGFGYNATLNGGVILSGFTQVPSPLQSAQYGPLQDLGTFTGATQNAGTQIGSNTQLAATATANMYSFNLINGNIGTVYTTQAGQCTLSINTPDGTSVALISVAGATAASTNTGPGVVSGCCTTGGNVIVTWFEGGVGQLFYAAYTQTGAVVRARTSLGIGSATRFHSTIAVSGGGWFIAGNSSANTQTQFVSVSSTFVVGSVFSGGMSADHTVACQLTSGDIALAGPNPNVSQFQVAVVRANGTIVYQGAPTGNSTNCFAGIVPLQGNQYAVSFLDGGNNGIVLVRNGSFNSTLSNTSLGTTNVSLGCTMALQLNQELTPTLVIFSGNGGGQLRLMRVAYPSGTNGTGTVTIINASFQSVASFIGYVVNSLNNRVIISWSLGAALPNIASYAINTIANGTTGVSGGNYTLKEGWTLLGVAATDVSAGGAGPVITNGGSVALNANYPVVTPSIAFNYQGANNSFAQRGTVSNRVAILQGLEI